MNIFKLREKKIIGKCVDLVPVSEELLSDVVRLRNQEKSKYFLNQQMDLTLEMQKEWYKDYLTRDNDIYWCVLEKTGNVIGTIRLYDITEDSCEEGSFIIDENYTMGLPYALETYVLSLDIAFSTLNMKSVINTDRKDNKTMNSMTKKMGFIFEKEVLIGGIEFNRYILTKENAKIEKYNKLLESFMG